MSETDMIKTLMQEKSLLQVIWIVIFSVFLAIVKVFYSEIKHFYDIIRSGILCVSAGIMVGILCWHFDVPYLLTILFVSLASFSGELFWDGITNEFPRVFRTVLESYLKKGK